MRVPGSGDRTHQKIVNKSASIFVEFLCLGSISDESLQKGKRLKGLLAASCFRLVGYELVAGQGNNLV